VMRQRRTASAILAGAGAIVLAVFLWPGGTGTPSPKRAPAKTSVADRVSLINVKIPSKALSAPTAIAAAGNRVWIANSFYRATNDAGWVTELNARTGALIRVISARRDGLTDPEAIAAAGNRVWVVTGSTSTITELDAGGALIRVISGKRYQLDSGGFAVAIAAGGNEIWVPNANGNSITEINATTGALIRVITSLPNYSFATVAGGSGVWFVTNVGVKGVDGSGPAGSITDLSAATGQLVHNIAATPFATSYPGGAITAAGGHVWVADTNFYSAAGWVAELSAATGVLTRVISG
jgi:DNA-binding beta-propeller fold protein YncE